MDHKTKRDAPGFHHPYMGAGLSHLVASRPSLRCHHLLSGSTFEMTDLSSLMRCYTWFLVAIPPKKGSDVSCRAKQCLESAGLAPTSSQGLTEVPQSCEVFGRTPVCEHVLPSCYARNPRTSNYALRINDSDFTILLKEGPRISYLYLS